MLDVTTSLAPFVAEVTTDARMRAAGRRRWLRLLREMRAKDREAALKAAAKTITVDKPSHLAGVHRL